MLLIDYSVKRARWQNNHSSLLPILVKDMDFCNLPNLSFPVLMLRKSKIRNHLPGKKKKKVLSQFAYRKASPMLVLEMKD